MNAYRLIEPYAGYRFKWLKQRAMDRYALSLELFRKKPRQGDENIGTSE